MAKRVCVFCGGRPVSAEHVFPQWIRTGLPEGLELVHERETADRVTEWTAVNFTLTCQRVCGSCNSGWMNDLEGAARPTLKSMMSGHGVGFMRMTSGVRQIRITIVNVRGGQVRVGIEAPQEFEIARSELDEEPAVQRPKRAAASRTTSTMPESGRT